MRPVPLFLLFLAPALAHSATLTLTLPDPLYEDLRTAVVGTVEAPASAAAVQAYVQKEGLTLFQGRADFGRRQQAAGVVEAYLTGDPARRRAIDEATRTGTTRAPLDRGPGQAAGPTLRTLAAVPLLAWLLGGAWDLGAWVVGLMLSWAAGYLLWEAKPCRRLLFCVTRRLYGRSLED